MNNIKRNLNPQWRELLQNPVWYVTTVAIMMVLTSYVNFVWWFVGLVALVWGAWLIRHFIGDNDENGSANRGRIHLEVYLEQTQAYKTEIDRAIKETKNDHNRFQLEHLAAQLDTCAKAIKELVQRLVSFGQDDLILRDLEMVPQAIADLEVRLADETNAIIVTQLERVLISRNNQLALLKRLQNTIKQTELQVEHTLSVLGSIYSQILIGQSTNDMADYGRFSANVDEEMRRLADQLEALGEVKGDYIQTL